MRYIELEAARGIAAIVVLIHHCLLGFAPHFHGLVAQPVSISLYGTPFFAAINGSAAVVFFFALSGFVLTAGIIDRGGLARLSISAAKRLPRLAGPVLIVNIAAANLFVLGFNRNIELEQIVKSGWLALHMNWQPWEGDFGRSIYEGAWGSFIRGTSLYNPNLWTMYYEFWGSLIALGLAVPFVLYPRLRNHWWVLALVTVAMLGLPADTSTYFVPFIAGVCVSVVRHSVCESRLSTLAVIGLLGGSFLLLGYHEPLSGSLSSGFYAPLDPIAVASGVRLRVGLHTVASIAIIVVLLNRRGEVALLRGGAARFLGRLSFPIYLTQMSAILTGGCATYLALDGLSPSPRALCAIVVSAALALASALPVMVFDRWWTGQLRSWTAPVGRPN